MNVLRRAAVLGFLAASYVACSGGGGNEEPPPPPPKVYKSFAYVANFNSYNISAYAINVATGALTEIAGSPFAAGALPNFVATIHIK